MKPGAWKPSRANSLKSSSWKLIQWPPQNANGATIMRVLGVSELGRRAQNVMRDDARCADMLAIEADGALHIHRCVVPHDEPQWAGHYSPWAKIVPVAEIHNTYQLEH